MSSYFTTTDNAGKQRGPPSLSSVLKITSLNASNSVSLGDNAFNLLDENARVDFLMLSTPENNLKYVNLDTSDPYTIYLCIL